MVEIARHQIIVCDMCGHPTDELAGKVSWVPNIPGVAPLNWNNYTHTAHIGMCCKDKLFTAVKFDKRMTKTQYRERRQQQARRSTVRAKRNAA